MGSGQRRAVDGLRVFAGRIRLPAEGKGQGKAIPPAKLTLDKDGLEIENYKAQPVRLNEITVVLPKEKK